MPPRRAEQLERYAEQLDSIANSDGKVWLNSPNGHLVRFVPLTMRRAAIISVANLKGGVGKTTITANLGATLANLGLKVLLMDLDYQSSLSNLCLLPQEKDEVRRAGRYLNGFLETGGDLSRLNQSVTLLDAGLAWLSLSGTSRRGFRRCREPSDGALARRTFSG